MNSVSLTFSSSHFPELQLGVLPTPTFLMWLPPCPLEIAGLWKKVSKVRFEANKIWKETH